MHGSVEAVDGEVIGGRRVGGVGECSTGNSCGKLFWGGDAPGEKPQVSFANLGHRGYSSKSRLAEVAASFEF